MAAIQLGVSEYRRTAQAPILLSNMYVENDPTNVIDGKVRLQRPALSSLVVLGDGPVRGMAQQDGVFNGDVIVVAGTTFFRMTTAGATPFTASFPAGGFVNTAMGLDRSISVGTDGTAWSFNGTALTQVAMPSGIGVAWVTYINGYFLLGQQNAQRIYWLAPGDVNPDPLNFFSAESQPDNTVGASTLADDVWIFGISSVEVWSPSGDSTLPFTRSQGRLYDKGCASRDTIVQLDNTLFWVGNDRIVYRADSVPIRISNNSVEEALRSVLGTSMRAWAFAIDGHLFYLVTLTQSMYVPTEGTFVFDVSQSNWPQWSSYGYSYLRAHFGVQYDGRTVFAGDALSGQIWFLDPTVSHDSDSPILREMTGFVGLLTQYARCNSLELSAARGLGVSYATPIKLDVRWSDDEGNTWTSWREMSLGKRGQYGVRLQLQALGRMYSPGRTFHFRCADASQLRISYARINEGGGGAS